MDGEAKVGAAADDSTGVVRTPRRKRLCFHLLHGRAYAQYVRGASIGEHYEEATCVQPEWEVKCKLSFRIDGRSYGYTDPVPGSDDADEHELDVEVSLLAAGGAKRKDGRAAQSVPTQVEADAAAAASMRIALAAAAPSQQRMMLQRALDKGKFIAWERATVAERDMCMHLPQEELLNAMGSGDSGVDQFLESVRISLMVEEDAVRRDTEAPGRKHIRGKAAARKQSWRRKDMQEAPEEQRVQLKGAAAGDQTPADSNKGPNAEQVNSKVEHNAEASAQAPSGAGTTTRVTHMSLGDGSAPPDAGEVAAGKAGDVGTLPAASKETAGSDGRDATSAKAYRAGGANAAAAVGDRGAINRSGIGEHAACSGPPAEVRYKRGASLGGRCPPRGHGNMHATKHTMPGSRGPRCTVPRSRLWCCPPSVPCG